MDCRLIAAIPINGIKNSFPGNVPGLNARIFRFRAKTEGKVGVNAKIDAAFGFGTGAALGLLPSRRRSHVTKCYRGTVALTTLYCSGGS